MAQIQEKLSILGQFSLNENKIAQLYSAYALKFPERQTLWEGLAKDERRHSALLADLDVRYSKQINSWQISENAPAILDYVCKFIDDCLRQVETNNLSLDEALKNGLSLEQSMVEKKNFDIFKTVAEEVRLVLEKLNRETEGHRLWLSKFIKENI